MLVIIGVVLQQRYDRSAVERRSRHASVTSEADAFSDEESMRRPFSNTDTAPTQRTSSNISTHCPDTGAGDERKTAKGKTSGRHAPKVKKTIRGGFSHLSWYRIKTNCVHSCMHTYITNSDTLDTFLQKLKSHLFPLTEPT